MIRINLLSSREIEAELGRRQDVVVTVLGVGTALALCLAVFLYQFFRTTMLQREVSSLRAEIASIEGGAQEVAQLQKTIASLKQKVTVIENLSKKKVGPVRVMESLSASAPERLWVTEFKENGGNLTLNGMAIDNQTVADFLKALQGTQYFRDVELVEAAQTQQDKLALKKFSVRSQLLYQPQPEQKAKAAATPASADGKVAKP
ncbi:MAG TPA: PilN domain-containing protein [Candidatus Binatia bacterium]|nr:PilN domain-containing protein [Candidatus Binatia bacterium]